MRIIIETGYINPKVISGDKVAQEGGWVSSDKGSIYAIYIEGHRDKGKYAFDITELPNLMMKVAKEVKTDLPGTEFRDGNAMEKRCKTCGSKLLWEHPKLAGTIMESSSSLENWPICKDCMIEHCVHANCLGCDYGKYPECRFVDMKLHYRDNSGTTVLRKKEN